MDTAIAIGIGCGLVFGGILTAIILKLTKNDGSVKCKYDERQTLVRGRGFKYGFFTLMVYDLIYGFLDMALERRYADNFTALFMGVCLGVLVYVSYCIWNEGYFSMNENPRRVLAAFAIIAVINFSVSAYPLTHDELLTDGMLTYHCTNLVCGLLFVVIFLELLVKWLMGRKEEE